MVNVVAVLTVAVLLREVTVVLWWRCIPRWPMLAVLPSGMVIVRRLVWILARARALLRVVLVSMVAMDAPEALRIPAVIVPIKHIVRIVVPRLVATVAVPIVTAPTVAVTIIVPIIISTIAPIIAPILVAVATVVIITIVVVVVPVVTVALAPVFIRIAAPVVI